VMTSKDQGVRSIFERMSPEEMEALFERDGKQARVRPRFRDGIIWQVGDANDPDLVEALGMRTRKNRPRPLCYSQEVPCQWLSSCQLDPASESATQVLDGF